MALMPKSVYGAVGRAMYGGKVLSAGEHAYNTALRAAKGVHGAKVASATAASEKAMKQTSIRYGKKPVLVAGGIGLMGAAGAMRPGKTSQQTGYSGPRPMTNTPSGSGRYA